MIKEKKKILYYWLICIVSFIVFRIGIAIIDGSELTPFFDTLYGILGAILVCTSFVFFIWAMILILKWKASKKVFIFRTLIVILLIPLSSMLCFYIYSITIGLYGKDALCYFFINLGDKKTFVATDNSCSIMTPENWMKRPVEKEIIYVGDFYNKNKISMCPFMKKNIKASSLEEVTKIIEESLKKNIKYPTRIESKIIKINNSKASIIIPKPVSNKNVTWTYNLYIIDKKDAFYYFVCATSLPNKKYANKVFRDIVNSFKELPIVSKLSASQKEENHNKADLGNSASASSPNL